MNGIFGANSNIADAMEGIGAIYPGLEMPGYNSGVATRRMVTFESKHK
jgi:hypothetical protein